MPLGPVIRRCALIAALAAADAGTWALFAGDRMPGWHAPFADLLVAGAAWAVQLGLGWLTLLTAMVLVEPLVGRDLTSYAACPAGLRRALLVVCGAAVAGSLIAPSYAADGGADRHHPGRRSVRVDGLPLPDRAVGGSVAAPTPRTPHHAARGVVSTPARVSAASAGTVVVRPGDCLWDLAVAALRAAGDPASSDAAIDHAWRSIYAANRSVIGPDPDALVPGAVLHIPHHLSPKEQP